MPLDAVQTVLSAAFFDAMGVRNSVVVEEAWALGDALRIAAGRVGEIDAACSRFQPESELCALNRRAGGPPLAVSPLLEQALEAALSAAEMTGGLVDPTVGRCLEDIGYSVTFGAVPADGPALELCVRGVAGWKAIDLDIEKHTVRLPRGVALDLGASGKAWAADAAAEAVASTLDVAVLVECGGDVAARGTPAREGWPVHVASEPGATDGQVVRVGDGGLATSGVTSRRWRRGGVEVHDIIDPRTGGPAKTPWAMVTVAAATCLEANAAATAALILGDEGPAWLESLRLPARLVRLGGGLTTVAGWAA